MERNTSTVKNRSIRLDDENYAWLQGLPGRSINDALIKLRINGHADNSDVTQCNAEISEILDLVRTIAANTEIRNPVLTLPTSASEAGIDNRPKNCACKHCGGRFAGPRFTTICSECKSSGHTLLPAECPVCNETRAL